MKTAIFDKKGKELKQVELPKDIFDVVWNADLVHEVVTSIQSNARSNTAHAKDRSEVRGGGAKPWRQKGTGRARVGSIRSPIWRGGGATFGPRNERNYAKKINKKVRAKALAMVLSQKAKDGELILIGSLETSEIKTKEAQSILNAITKKFKDLISRTTLVVLLERSNTTEKSFRNIKNVRLDLVQNMNILDILNHKYLIIENPEKAFEILKARITNK